MARTTLPTLSADSLCDVMASATVGLTAPAYGKDIVLRMAVPDWPPTRIMKDLTGSYSGGLYGLALLGFIAALVCALSLHIPNRLPSSEAAVAPAE